MSSFEVQQQILTQSAIFGYSPGVEGVYFPFQGLLLLFRFSWVTSDFICRCLHVHSIEVTDASVLQLCDEQAL